MAPLLLLALIASASCSGPWQAPVPGPVLRAFQPPSAPWGAGHRGVDLLAAPGDPVRSPTDGQVSVAGAIGGRPVLVVVDDLGRRATLEPVTALVAPGDVVRAGELVGVVGGGGHCGGRCIHLGARVDPPGAAPAYLAPLSLMGCRAVLRPDP